MYNRKFTEGDIVQHFKREWDNRGNTYLYEIIGHGQHTETREDLVIYRALYGDGGIFARPSQMFYSKVDRDKYPEIRQEYRFEFYGGEMEEGWN